MKTLENIVYNVETGTTINLYVGYLENSKFQSKQMELTNQTDIQKFGYLIDIVKTKISDGQELISFLAQITQDQHMSEERIRYIQTDESFGFFPISQMSSSQKTKYNNVKTIIQAKLDEL